MDFYLKKSDDDDDSWKNCFLCNVSDITKKKSIACPKQFT